MMAEGRDWEGFAWWVAGHQPVSARIWAQPGIIGETECYPQPSLPVCKVLGVLLEGLAELFVGGLEVAGQLLGWVPQGSQAQLLLQPLLGAAASRVGVVWEGRALLAGFG